MNRIDFIKSIGLGTGGIILPTNSFLSSEVIKVYDNYVRGLKHYQFSKIKNELKEGDAIQLIRESTNVYDSFAIQVNINEHRLGYLPAYENIVLANMMDKGVNLSCYISKLDLKRDFYECLAVEVFAELVIPSQKLIDSMLAEKRADDVPDIYRKSDLHDLYFNSKG